MTVEIEFGVNLPEADRTVLTDDDIIRHNPVKTHTGKADFTAQVRGNRGLEKYAKRQDRINITYSSGTEWTGFLTDVSHNKASGTTRIKADGVEKRLEETRPDYSSGPVTYSNIAIHNALRDYWGRTPFNNVTVTDQTTELVTENEEIINADTNSELSNYFTPAADQPIAVQNGQVELLQTGFVGLDEGAFWSFEADNSAASGDFNNTNNVTGIGEFSSSGDTMSLSFNLDHEVPAGNLSVYWRTATKGSFLDNGNGYTYPGFHIEIDGNTVFSTVNDWGSSEREWKWQERTTSDTKLGTGTHTVDFVCDQAGDGTKHDNFGVDLVAVVDNRFNYFFDNDNGNPYAWGSDADAYDPAYLDGPELYPGTQTITMSSGATTSYNVRSGAIDSTWNDTSGGQELALSNDDGANFKRVSNSQTLDVDFDTAGRTVLAQLSLDRYGSRTGTTPKLGYLGQAMDNIIVTIDGDDLTVIDSMELTRNHFDNLKQLHQFGDYVWVVEHDSAAIADLVVSSFQRGDETRPAPDGFDKQANQQPEIQSGTYYNSIYLEGALRDDGTRPTAEVKDQDAINNDGREISPGVLRDLSIITDAGAEFRARALLDAAQSNNDLVGSVTVPPMISHPGYARPVDFGNGETYKTVEEVSLSLGANSAKATFDFTSREGFVNDIDGLKRNSREVGNQV